MKFIENYLKIYSYFMILCFIYIVFVDVVDIYIAINMIYTIAVLYYISERNEK